MPHRSPFSNYVPFVPAALGLLASTWRFRAHDSVGGLALGLVGIVLMLVVACWMFRSDESI